MCVCICVCVCACVCVNVCMRVFMCDCNEISIFASCIMRLMVVVSDGSERCEEIVTNSVVVPCISPIYKYCISPRA